MKRLDFLRSVCGCGLGLAGGASVLGLTAGGQFAADKECDAMRQFNDV